MFEKNEDIGERTDELLKEYTKTEASESFEEFVSEADDDFINNVLGKQWRWQGQENEKFYSLENGRLRLNAVNVNSVRPIYDAPNLLFQPVKFSDFQVMTKIKLRLKEDGDMAGIAVTGGGSYCIRAEKYGDQLFIKQANYVCNSDKNNAEDIIYSSKLRNDSDIYLKIEMKDEGKISFFFGYSADDIFKLGVSSIYNVLKEKPNSAAVGIFCLNSGDKASEGYAKFEYVRFNRVNG